MQVEVLQLDYTVPKVFYGTISCISLMRSCWISSMMMAKKSYCACGLFLISPFPRRKRLSSGKRCDGMIELSGQLLHVQVLEAPIPAIPDERGQGYEDMVLVLTAEQKKIRLSIQELFAFEESMHGMSVRQAEECNMLAKFMPIAASKMIQEIPEEHKTSAASGYCS